MNDYIDAFVDHLKESIEIGNTTRLSKCEKKISNVLICGLGGSGIGGSIIANITAEEIVVPVVSTKDYSVPNFVNEETLVIASSYSGNTEETLYALRECEKRGAEIAIVTSGGELKRLAQEKNYNHILIPSGHPPRAMFGYSFTQLFFMLNHYGLISDNFKNDFEKAINLLIDNKEGIQEEAKSVAKKLYGNTPVIYSASNFEGAAIRFRQQINENSKMLCWHHVVPEMNHNELLGWRTNVDSLAVVYLRNNSDFDRNQIRMKINQVVLEKYTSNITEIWSKGDSLIENTFYHIHLGDWISWYLSEMNNVDAIEIDVIDYLKSELGKVQ